MKKIIKQIIFTEASAAVRRSLIRCNREIKHDVCFSPRTAKILLLPSAVWRLYVAMSRFVFVVNVCFFPIFSEGFM